MTKSIVIITTSILSGCLATQPSQPVAALLEQSSAENRILLERAIGDFLNSDPIKLADNIFSQESTVVVDRSPSTNSRGNLLDGREMQAADSFSLLTENGLCYLKHDQSENIKLLDNIRCTSK